MRKYILLLLIIGIPLLAFNRKHLFVYDSDELIMDIQLLGLALVLLSLILSLIPKLRKPIFLRVLLIISISIVSTELILSYRSLQVFNRISFTNNYNDHNCDKLLERFEYDKTQNKFAYFEAGIGIDSEGIKREFKEKYNVDVVAIGLGCSGDSENHCYNMALMDYLESKK
ncbi:hypothetical protein [Brumimicrobium mesophilum]|uniref:hypothetical protein n=1 Tax=Brumimicrobium mesophilum TaxID=392717 RepID=UPI000D13FBCE|nr:hypothetical protein [Brumimicrobium mesophilum]